MVEDDNSRMTFSRDIAHVIQEAVGDDVSYMLVDDTTALRDAIEVLDKIAVAKSNEECSIVGARTSIAAAIAKSIACCVEGLGDLPPKSFMDNSAPRSIKETRRATKGWNRPRR